MNIQADGAGITAFHGMESFQPAPLLNLVVRHQRGSSSTMCEFLKLALTFLLGFFSAVFAEPSRRWLFRPNIVLAFRPKFGVGSRFIALTPEDTNRMAKYIRASASNKSWVTAKSCKVFLTMIEKEVEKNHFRPLHHDPLPLPWAYLGASAIDIPPGMEFFFDIFAVNDQENRIEPQTYPMRPHSWKNLLQESGRYKFSVVVAGENLRLVPLSLCFVWKGSFDSVTEECFP